MRIALCDDDQKDLLLLNTLLSEYDISKQLEIVSFSNADDFLRECDKTEFDIALLDIEMKGTNGYDAAKLLSIKDNCPLMVFVTNSTTYSVRGYGLVFRYLVKPVQMDSLSAVMDASIREVKANRFSFAIDGSAHVLHMEDIYYIEVYNHTTILHTIDETFSLRLTLKDVLSQLPQGYFGMPHQSYIVNFVHVKTATVTLIRLTNSASIPVSRRKRKDFMHQLNSYLGR